MAIQIQGQNGTIAQVDGPAFRAVRTTLRPIDYDTLGAYRVSLLSGTIAAGLAAPSDIWQLRWTDATRLCIVTSVTVDGIAGGTTGFTAGLGNLQLFTCRSWSADGSGGTAATLTLNNAKSRASMASSLMGAIRIASTVALGAGTRVLDAQPVGQLALAFPATASLQFSPIQDLFHVDPGGEHPIVLTQNEGLCIRASVPATGNWQTGVTVTWTEAPAY